LSRGLLPGYLPQEENSSEKQNTLQKITQKTKTITEENRTKQNKRKEGGRGREKVERKIGEEQCSG
jgi:hypothetical protein